MLLSNILALLMGTVKARPEQSLPRRLVAARGREGQ